MATPQIFKDYIVRFRKGDRVYSSGDPGTEMYIVQSGAVEIFQEAASERVSLAIMEKGDFFGEMALIEAMPHSTCAEALSDSELIEINSTLFDKMIKANIEIAVRMLRKLSIRLREATRRIEHLASQKTTDSISQKMPAVTPVDAPPPPPPLPPVSMGTRPSPAATRSSAQGPHPNGCHAMFVGEEGSEVFHLVSNRAMIGRFDPVTGLKPEVDLSAVDLNRSVSRNHARLTFEGGVYSLTEEVGALNGTFVNGRKLVSGKSVRLKDGDVVNMGMVKLTFHEVSG